MPVEPPTLDYAQSRPVPRSSRRIVAGFLVGWCLGVVGTGVAADIYRMATRGSHDDGTIYCIAAAAIVLEAPTLAVLRAALGSRVNGGFAFAFGLACGPLILIALIARG